MGWLAILARLGDLLSGLLDWLKERRLAARVETDITARQMKETLDALDAALAARRDADHSQRVDGLRADDGHRRD